MRRCTGIKRTKKKVAKALRIAWFKADLPQERNTSEYRVHQPAKRLAQAGCTCFVSHVGELISGNISPETKKTIAESDVIVIERLLLKEVHPLIQMWRSWGKQVWSTFDDAYHLMPDSVSRDTWRGGKSARNGNGAILNEFREGLRLCTGFMTPSKLLCSEYAKYNPRAEYVPNYLDEDLWKDVKSFPPVDTITVGYGGTSLHNESLKNSGVISALGKLCRENPKVTIHLQPPFPDVVETFRKLGVRFTAHNWQPFEAWPKTVASFSLGIVPLGNRYDLYRSSLKCQELAWAGVPWVATDEAPYKDARGGISVYNKSNEWYRALNELISNLTLYRKLSEEGMAWSRSFNGKCAERYMEVFSGR